MIQSFLTNWPDTVNLYVYTENCSVVESAPNLIVRDLLGESSELKQFKDNWKNVPKANGDISQVPHLAHLKDKHKKFKWDAVRFAHKVYAIFHCAKNCDADVLFWMDADTVCHSKISESFISNMANESIDIGYLGRKNKYTECGLYSMNLKRDVVQLFLTNFQKMYDDAENGIFKLTEWHDSFVFDFVLKSLPNLRKYNWSEGIITGEGHPLINSEWGAYLDHLKGDRKALGKSKNSDLKIKRTETYWR
jgi:hypothetical protein